MKDERRISLRMEAEFYDRLDDKRHVLRTSFQEIGISLLKGWLEERKPSADKPSTTKANVESFGQSAGESKRYSEVFSAPNAKHLLELLAQILEKQVPYAIEGVTRALRFFSEEWNPQSGSSSTLESASAEQFPGAVRKALEATPEHPEPLGHLGTGTGRSQPGSWRKLGPHGRKPGPTKTAS